MTCVVTWPKSITYAVSPITTATLEREAGGDWWLLMRQSSRHEIRARILHLPGVSALTDDEAAARLGIVARAITDVANLEKLTLDPAKMLKLLSFVANGMWQVRPEQ